MLRNQTKIELTLHPFFQNCSIQRLKLIWSLHSNSMRFPFSCIENLKRYFWIYMSKRSRNSSKPFDNKKNLEKGSIFSKMLIYSSPDSISITWKLSLWILGIQFISWWIIIVVITEVNLRKSCTKENGMNENEFITNLFSTWISNEMLF